MSYYFISCHSSSSFSSMTVTRGTTRLVRFLHVDMSGWILNIHLLWCILWCFLLFKARAFYWFMKKNMLYWFRHFHDNRDTCWDRYVVFVRIWMNELSILKRYEAFYQFTCDSRWCLWLKMINIMLFYFIIIPHRRFHLR